MSCVLCHGVIQKATQRFLIDGKAKFDVRTSLSKLPFTVEINNFIYICKFCLDKLKKLDNLKRQQLEVVDNLEKLYKSTKYDVQVIERCEPVDVSEVKRQRVEPPSVHVPPVSISPVLRKAASDCSPTISILEQSTLVPVCHSTPKKLQSAFAVRRVATSCCKSASDGVTVKLQWSCESKPRERHLPVDLQSLGKMLVRGTYKQIANAAWNNLKLRKQLQILALKHVDSECNSLCSRKQPSCLRSPNKDQLMEFSFEKLEKELYRRAPFTHAILHTSCVNRRNADKRNEWVPSAGMAAAVLLRNKSTRMNAVQLLLSIFLYHSSWTVGMNHECTHAQFNKCCPYNNQMYKISI